MSDTSGVRGATHAMDDYRWLTGPVGQHWLARAAALEGELAARLGRLRGELSPQRAGLVVQQVELRRRALEKFAHAAEMFFTPLGLEQATDEVIAHYKAARFAGRDSRFDLCCGIGGDLMALAAGGRTIGIDRDPVCAVLAEANMRASLQPKSDFAVRVADVAAIDLSRCDAWHIDPDRRPGGRRTTRVALHEPNAEALDRLLSHNPHAAIKLAPAATWPEHWTQQAEWEWIGRDRQCRQLVAWFGSLAEQVGRRRATVLVPGAAPRSIVGSGSVEVPPAARIERYLFEPEAVVRASRLSGALAAEHGLAAIAPGVDYWTGGAPVHDALLSCFEVEEVLPLDVKRLKALLRARCIGRLEIKVRGAEQDPAALRKRLQPTGRLAAVLLVTRMDRGVTAILARRME